MKDTPDDAGNSNEVRIMTNQQSYGNVHVYIPDTQNYDDHGGRPSSEIMVTSVDQTVPGKKFSGILKYQPQQEIIILLPKNMLMIYQIQNRTKQSRQT